MPTHKCNRVGGCKAYVLVNGVRIGRRMLTQVTPWNTLKIPRVEVCISHQQSW